MKKIILLITLGFSISGILNAQTRLDNSTYQIEYLVTDQIENQFDTLVQVNLIIEVENMNELSKILVFGGSEEGLSDKVFERIDPADRNLLESQKLQILEDKKIRIRMGIFNLAREMIFFGIKLEDTSGDITMPLKQIYPKN